MTSWAAHADTFAVCIFKRRENATSAGNEFLDQLEMSVRGSGGKIQLRTDKPRNWEFLDGNEHFREPNHLNPAIFDFDAIVLVAFPCDEELHAWWSSDQVFKLLKGRDPIEKMGIFVVEGLQQAFDVEDRNRLSQGDKMVLFEFMKVLSFKPMQQYVDDYKRLSEGARRQIGVECNLLFAEGVSGVLMNEFPLEAACASGWRLRTDAHLWYDSDGYQADMKPIRKEFSRCLTVLVPIFEDKEGAELTAIQQFRKLNSVAAKLKLGN